MSNTGTGNTGTILQGAGAGATAKFSTATYPSLATGAGTILRADGTNWEPTTATFPNTAGTSGNVLTSDGTNWVSSAPSSGATISVATVTLTSAEIKAAMGTPVTVIPAPGAGQIILPIVFWGSFNYGGTNAFTNGQILSVRWNNAGVTTSAFGGSLISGTQIEGTADAYVGISPASSSATRPPADIENKPVVVVNVGGSEITGNAANNNTITVVVLYYTRAIF